MIEPLMYLLSAWFDGLSTWVLVAMGAVLALLFVPKLGVVVLKLAAQAGVGSLVIMGINWALGGFGLFVGLNLVTVLVTGLLGLPGVVSLYVLSVII